MHGDQPISWLMFFTLAATVFIIAGGFILFLRSRTNRAIAADALEGRSEGRSARTGPAPDGAAPELIGFAVLALAAMGLLTVGYHNTSSMERAETATPVGVTTGMAQPVGSADQPKQYQPVNPAPDQRAAPTSSDTGAGPENGSTGNPK